MGSRAEAQQPQKPNIILINLDDADYDLLSDGRSRSRFPNITDMATAGMRFSNVHAVIPLCGPSRACLLRGQYAHNTGSKVNKSSPERSNGFDGGMVYYRDQGFFEDDLSTWMKSAGYRTMMVGKFLHSDFIKIIPPGWDDFYYYLGGRYFDFYRFSSITPKGRFEHFPTEYRTVVEAQNAIELIEDQTLNNPETPFFLLLQPLGPHRHQRNSAGMIDFEQYGNAFPSARVPTNAAFNELDISDKVGPAAELSRLDDSEFTFVNEHYRDRVIATKSCDDMVGDILAKIKELGIEDNTYVFLTSDNGYSLGFNRWIGKGGHYSTTSQVPLIAWGPSVSDRKRADHLVANIDLVPTILELASAPIPDIVDGKSFAELLANPNAVSPAAWQSGILVENWENYTSFGKDIRAVSTTLRKFDTVYTEHANGDKEFYRLASDPYQTENVYGELSAFEQLELAFQLKSLKNPQKPATARFSQPYEDNQRFLGGVRLNGVAEDAIGVASVKLAIQDRNTGLYWNGESWNTGFQQVDAELASQGDGLTEWSYRFQPSEEMKPVGLVGVWVWGFDQNNRFAPPQRRILSLVPSGPTASIENPVRFDILTTPQTFRGTCFASAGIQQVLVSIRNTESLQYWDGAEFVDEVVHLVADLDNTGRWLLPADLPPGEYRMSVISESKAGQESEEARVVFSID